MEIGSEPCGDSAPDELSGSDGCRQRRGGVTGGAMLGRGRWLRGGWAAAARDADFGWRPWSMTMGAGALLGWMPTV